MDLIYNCQTKWSILNYGEYSNSLKDQVDSLVKHTNQRMGYIYSRGVLELYSSRNKFGGNNMFEAGEILEKKGGKDWSGTLFDDQVAPVSARVLNLHPQTAILNDIRDFDRQIISRIHSEWEQLDFIGMNRLHSSEKALQHFTMEGFRVEKSRLIASLESLGFRITKQFYQYKEGRYIEPNQIFDKSLTSIDYSSESPQGSWDWRDLFIQFDEPNHDKQR